MDESFDVTICNPPFHSSPGDAESGTLRKLNNLNSEKISTPVLNFGGQNRELWTPGGEEFFVNKMIEESAQYRENCFWFTTLIDPLHQSVVVGYFVAVWVVAVEIVSTVAGTVIAVFVLACYAVQLLY